MTSLHSIFKDIPAFEASDNLEGRIFRAIRAERIALGRKSKVLFSFGFVVSAASLIVAVLWYGGAVASSDFWSMTMLAFSDADVVATHWSDFLFSLLETFPVAETVVLLVPVFVLMLLAEEYARRVSSYRRLSF